MSNVAFNFLSNSFLFKENSKDLQKRNIVEIEQELDNYRNYLNSVKTDLDKECINEGRQSIAMSDFRGINNLPKISELTSKALFLNKFIIDDPLFSTSFKNLDIINNDRQLRGFPILTDEKIKIDLLNKIAYMKALTPGVDSRVKYIKFYPLSKEPTNELLSFINTPELDFPNTYPEIFKWFNERIFVKKVDETKAIVELTGPCKQLAISFKEDDGFGVFLPAYLQAILTSGAGYAYKNIVPTTIIFEKWKNEEIIKSIRDRFETIMRKNDYRLKFGSVISTESKFEFEFLGSILDEESLNTAEAKALKIVTHLSMPSVHSDDFDLTMQIREYFDNEFENFRTKLKENVLSFRSITDEKELNIFAAELSKMYESEIKEIEGKLKSKFDFKTFGYFPAGIEIATILASPEPISKTLTGLGLLYEIYKGFRKNPSEAKENQCFFLYKLKR